MVNVFLVTATPYSARQSVYSLGDALLGSAPRNPGVPEVHRIPPISNPNVGGIHDPCVISPQTRGVETMLA